MASKSTTKTTNPIINTILVISVGLSALEISQLFFDPSNAASLTALELNPIVESMFEGMFLSAETLVSFIAVWVAWIISGMIAGVRAKHGFWGVVAGFFGTLLGAGFLAVLNIDALQMSTSLTSFILGTVACTLGCCIAAYATGNATKGKVKTTKPKPTRKAWAASKTKEVWTCRKCGTSIPPGAFSCPTCGEPVIE
jgi:ribosomal protein L40E